MGNLAINDYDDEEDDDDGDYDDCGVDNNDHVEAPWYERRCKRAAEGEIHRRIGNQSPVMIMISAIMMIMISTIMLMNSMMI